MPNPADNDVVVHGEAERGGDSMVVLVIWMSACEGVGSPEGWLCTMDRAIYHVDSVGLLPRMQGQGSLIGGGRWCPFVTVPSGQSRSLGVLQRHGRLSNLL